MRSGKERYLLSGSISSHQPSPLFVSRQRQILFSLCRGKTEREKNPTFQLVAVCCSVSRRCRRGCARTRDPLRRKVRGRKRVGEVSETVPKSDETHRPRKTTRLTDTVNFSPHKWPRCLILQTKPGGDRGLQALL